MPSKNVVKEYVPNSYYHAFNRGIDNREIFQDEQDYTTFLRLLERYLAKNTDKKSKNDVSYYEDIELLSFNLMPTHFHLFIHVGDNPRSMSELIRRVCTSYTMYFNKKYHRRGKLFEGVFKAAKIDDEQRLVHVTRYIHRNHEDYYNWPYSSYPYYIKGWTAEWVRPDKIYALYEWGTYEDYTNNHDEYLATLEELKEYLAG